MSLAYRIVGCPDLEVERVDRVQDIAAEDFHNNTEMISRLTCEFKDFETINRV